MKSFYKNKWSMKELKKGICFLLLACNLVGCKEKEKQKNIIEEVNNPAVSEIEQEKSMEETKNNSVTERESAYDETIEKMAEEDKTYKASELWIAKVENQYNILEFVEERKFNNGLSMIEKQKWNEIGLAVKNEDCTENVVELIWKSVFEEEQEDSCTFTRQLVTKSVENSRIKINWHSTHDYYSNDGISYVVSNCVLDNASFEVDENYNKNEIMTYLDNLYNRSYVKKYYMAYGWPYVHYLEWDEDFSLVEFSEYFQCDLEDTFTKQELREKLQKLNAQENMIRKRKIDE